MEPGRTPYASAKSANLAGAGRAVGKVPKNVQRDGGADAGPAMHLRRRR